MLTLCAVATTPQAIQDGDLDFDTCIATPDMMAHVGKVARILVSPAPICRRRPMARSSVELSGKCINLDSAGISRRPLTPTPSTIRDLVG